MCIDLPLKHGDLELIYNSSVSRNLHQRPIEIVDLPMNVDVPRDNDINHC